MKAVRICSFIIVFLSFWSLNVSADEMKILEALEDATNRVIDPYTSSEKRQKLSEAVATVKSQIELYRDSENVSESLAQAAEACYQNMSKYEQCLSSLDASYYSALGSGDCENVMVQCRKRAPGLLEDVNNIYNEKETRD